MIDMARAHFEEVIASKITGTNTSCDYYPCHHLDQDCTWCFCPFYPCGDDQTGGKMVTSERTGHDVWSCIDCTWVHNEDVSLEVLEVLDKMEDIPDWDHEALKKLRTGIMEGR